MSASLEATDADGDYLDYQDLTLPLDPQLIFEAPPQHFQSIVYVKRQHELLDGAVHGWIRKARECRSDSVDDLQGQIALLAQGAARGADGSILEVRGNNWTHQQRLMQALFSIGPELQKCPPESLPAILDFLGPIVLDPIQDAFLTIEKTIKSAKIYCRQAIKLFENAIQKYHSTPGKHKMDSGGEVAHAVLDTKKEKCKAIYALSATLNHAIAFKESYILEKTDIFKTALNKWRSSGSVDTASVQKVFKPLRETPRFSALMFPPIQFPQDEFKTHFAKFSHSLMLPVSYRDLESLDPITQTPGQKAGYLFHRNRNGEWSRQYFYIQPKGMLMQFAKGKDIQVANLNQTLLRTINVDQRDFVFEICSIEVYLMESILQAATKVEFEEWKAALFHWHPPDDEIPQIDTLKISTPPVKPMLPRPRHMSISRPSDPALCSPKPRMSSEYPMVIKGDLFVLDLRAKPMNSQSKVGTWKRINCCIRSNGHFAQYNVGEMEKPFETIPLADTLRTHIWALDGSLFSKKHCFSIKAPHDVNYYTVSLKRSSTDQETFNAWLYALKSYAKPEIFGANEQLEYRLHRTFWILVNDGRLPKELEAYCEIMLDDQRRARTSTRMKATRNSDPEAPFWRDSFEFTDLAAFTKGITINVIQAKGSKLIPFGRTHIPVRNSEECDEGWYPILHVNDKTKTTEHLGDLRLKLQYEEQIVLPISNYSNVLEVILNFQENNVISKLAELVTDLEGFSRNVLRILEGRGMAVIWLNSLIDEEIAEADSTRVNTLFRGNTLLTKALDSYMRLVGTEYLDDTLGDILRSICKNKIACEVDPSRQERSDDLKTQWKILMYNTRTCWRAVTESVGYFPRELLLVFAHLQKRLTEKFSDRGPSGELIPDSDLASQARYTGVSGFVFLRLICPAILSPKLFYIVREHPEPRAHRTLTLIAKSLQGLANLVMFGTKESWMVPMNEFITENTKSLKDFIDQICLASNASGVTSRSNSVHSLSSQAPQSPASNSPSIFSRSHSKNGGSGSSGNGSGNGFHSSPSVTVPTGAGIGAGTGVGTGAGAGAGAGPILASSSVMSTPSTTSAQQFQGPTQTQTHSRNSLRAQAKDTVQPPSGTVDPTLMERNQDMPLLPHLIDLGKELAHFTTTVARVIPPWPRSSYENEQQPEGGNGEGAEEKAPSGSVTPRHEQDQRPRPRPRIKTDIARSVSGARDNDVDNGDILRLIGRTCWDVIETIQERVELSVQMEQEERLLAAQASTQAQGANGGTVGLGVSGLGVGAQGYTRGKTSREGSRDGEESYVVYEHYENQDMEAESFDGYTRGDDSDDEQRSAHDPI